MTTKDIRQLIHDRDEMEQTAPGTVATVELSHQIRHAMKNVRTDAAQLDKLQKDEKASYIKKNKQSEDREQQIEHRYACILLFSFLTHYYFCIQHCEY